jgi:predicted hydrocarbon binding protein
MSTEGAKQEIEGLKRRLDFAQRRFASLIEILESTLDEETFQDVIQGLGRYCSGTIGFIQEREGDVKGYFEEIRQRWGEEAEFDRERGVITVVTPERECVCPLVNSQLVPASICNCSLGWQKQTYETILGKPIEVELKESALRGSKRCVFEIHVT